ncbi:hypothetical protein JOF53_001997 [Crossiella equi]|uniref:Excreted virulence factor EspC, type VII ESX diderm n=1 Tax=Crossiella equi TaxID=130796 RepID=A0ABS5ABQ6_9PSEU|nr:hypothetical protein [Crossiella equi]MBP2473125.1 hypothetical protein [Crossiella equi]
MTVGNRYRVSDEELDRHARQVDDVKAKVGTAHGAAQQVGMGGVGAYGLLCGAVLVPALELIRGGTDDALASAAEYADAIAAGLRESRADYGSTDDQVRSWMEDMR